MFKNNREDILSGKLNNMYLSLVSNKINVLIVGAGKAGFIKAKTFTSKGCNVYVISKEFSCDFKELIGFNNFKVIDDSYDEKYILDKHIVVIATDNIELNEKIADDCIKNYKLYINSSNGNKGNCITPCQRETENIAFGINTKGVNPKASVYVAEKLNKEISKYDGFIRWSTEIRNNLKKVECKNQIMSFIMSDDFYFFYQKGEYKNILNMFYGGICFETNNCDS